MGSLEFYHILLHVNNDQEEAVKNLYIQNKWNYKSEVISDGLLLKLRVNIPVSGDSGFEEGRETQRSSQRSKRKARKYDDFSLNESDITPCILSGQSNSTVKKDKVDSVKQFGKKRRSKKSKVSKTEKYVKPSNKLANDKSTDKLTDSDLIIDERKLKNQCSDDRQCTESVTMELDERLTSETNIPDTPCDTKVVQNNEPKSDTIEDALNNDIQSSQLHSDVKSQTGTVGDLNIVDTIINSEPETQSCLSDNKLVFNNDLSENSEDITNPENVSETEDFEFTDVGQVVPVSTALLTDKGTCTRLRTHSSKMKVNKADNTVSSKRVKLEDGKVAAENLPIQCFFCSRRFAYEKYLKKHIKRVHPRESVGMYCEYCSANFKKRSELYTHIKAAHPDRRNKNIQCDLCGNVFKSKGSYDEHRKAVHTDVRAFECEICRKTYKSLRVLKIHRLRHGPANEICNICGKTFRLRSEVKHHMRRHMNDRRIQCDSCDKVFYRNSELRNHQRVHSGEKPYKCPLCAYACTIKGNLDKHLRTHEKSGVGFPLRQNLPEQKLEMVFKLRSNQSNMENKMSVNVIPNTNEVVIEPVSCSDVVTGYPQQVEHKMDNLGEKSDELMAVSGGDVSTVPTVWQCTGDMNQQERAAVETIQQWQLKGYEIIQGTQNIGNINNVSQTSTSSQNLVVVQNSGGLDESCVYTCMTSTDGVRVGDKSRMVTDVLANATAAVGIEVVYPGECKSDASDNKTDTLKSEQRLNYHPVYATMLPKFHEISNIQWPVSDSDKTHSSNIGMTVSVPPPLYSTLKTGEMIIKDNESIAPSWVPTSSTTGETTSNHIILQGFQGNIY